MLQLLMRTEVNPLKWAHKNIFMLYKRIINCWFWSFKYYSLFKSFLVKYFCRPISADSRNFFTRIPTPLYSEPLTYRSFQYSPVYQAVARPLQRHHSHWNQTQNVSLHSKSKFGGAPPLWRLTRNADCP